MKNSARLALVVCLIGFASCNAPGKAEIKTEKQKLSYAVGLQLGRQLKSSAIDFDSAAIGAAIDDSLSGKEPRLKPEEIQTALMAAQKAAMEKQKSEMEKREKDSVGNVAAGKKYLEENKKKPGVKVTPSGLQYEILKPGKGPKPKLTETVSVHYRGTLIDGTEFDSSFKRNQPAEFPLNRVIKGWTEGLQLMNVGSKARFVIPSELAYGPQGNPSIPGGSVLIFEVELLKIVK